ncbi:hypothetical protein SNE40_019404 [Patella caerulea]|uniref:Uncharacterized protein n=1 Tax=Patella caerulea TaxID=87958 RepID=A0AAN8J8H6_PATCE
MVMLLREFITAERTGNWKAHIHMLQKMLSYFAASGRNNYTKSVNLYLQDAVNVTTSKPEVFNFFFQRLLTATNVQDDPLKLFDYELCIYPPSLFNDSGLMMLMLFGVCVISQTSLYNMFWMADL